MMTNSNLKCINLADQVKYFLKDKACKNPKSLPLMGQAEVENQL